MSHDRNTLLGSLLHLADRMVTPHTLGVSQWLISPAGRPVSRFLGQIRAVMLLRDATEALEVEDLVAAEAFFMRVVGMDATRATRVMAYHGAVVSRLRLGRYQEAVQLADDAFLLLVAGGSPEELSEQDRAAHDALVDAREFGRWALAHPSAAADLRQRERRQSGPSPLGIGASPAVEAPPLGRATQWPESLASGYRVAVHGLLAAALVVAAAHRLGPARGLLRAALYAARYDHRIERDVCWHLARVDAELGLHQDAHRHRERYEALNERVKQALRRLRWTN